MSKYDHDPLLKSVYVYEASFGRNSHPSVVFKTKFVAKFAEEVVDYLNNRGDTVVSVRNIGFANYIL